MRDYEGNYDRFLEKNEGEAVVMAEKEAKKRELEKSQIKAKSKVGAALWCIPDVINLYLCLLARPAARISWEAIVRHCCLQRSLIQLQPVQQSHHAGPASVRWQVETPFDLETSPWRKGS